MRIGPPHQIPQRLLLFSTVFAALAPAFLFWGAPPARAANITVDWLSETSTPGKCTLRDAITAANNATSVQTCTGSGGADTINISVAGTLTLTSMLPTITQDLTINGNNITVNGNSSYQIFSVNSSVVFNLSNITLRNGLGAPDGGAIYNDGGTVSITNTNFLSNTAGFGGAIENKPGSTLRVVNSTFTSNSVSGSFSGGAAIDSAQTNLSILNSIFTNNSATISFGGAVWIYDNTTATIGNSAFLNNTAGGTASGGGVRIELSSTAAITNSAFIRNNAENGAGISIVASTVSITNSTLSGNKANDNGGGIYSESGSTITLNNITIANNVADNINDGTGDGGGINTNSGTVNTKNTIIAGNFDTPGNSGGETINPDCTGTLTTLGNNLLGNNNGCSGLTNNVSGDKVGTGASPLNPKLGGLAYYNGSTTLIHILLPNSPALNAGNNSTCAATDQRGVARALSIPDPCDMGAYEGVGVGLYLPLVFR